MSSPSLDLLCCSFQYPNASDIHPNNTSPTSSPNLFTLSLKRYLYLYHSTVIVMSVFSVLGALYVLYPKPGRTVAVGVQPGAGKVERRQKWILFWMSFADIMACLGLVVLSSESLKVLLSSDGDQGIPAFLSSSSWQWMCISTTAWIHFFFLATYMWTTAYAIDVFLFLSKSVAWKGLLKVYFVISWSFPLAFIGFGLWALYETIEPELACSAKRGDKYLLTVYYLCLFVPMVTVLVINPILYLMSGKKVSPLVRRRGMYTDRERDIERQVMNKFLKIVVVLVVCWFPNFINGILLLSEVPLTMPFYAVLWIFMAILNPLQAFLNAHVYWGPDGCAFLTSRTNQGDLSDTVPDYTQAQPPWRDATIPSDTETTPLIRGRTRDTLKGLN